MYPKTFSKKAQESLSETTFIDLVMLAVAVILMFGIANNARTSTTYDKLFLSKDTAVFIDTLHASPNTIILRYPQNTSGYVVEMAEAEVNVYAKGEHPDNAESFPYSPEEDIVFESKASGEADRIIFTKTNTKIIQN